MRSRVTVCACSNLTGLEPWWVRADRQSAGGIEGLLTGGWGSTATGLLWQSVSALEQGQGAHLGFVGVIGLMVGLLHVLPFEGDELLTIISFTLFALFVTLIGLNPAASEADEALGRDRPVKHFGRKCSAIGPLERDGQIEEGPAQRH